MRVPFLRVTGTQTKIHKGWDARCVVNSLRLVQPSCMSGVSHLNDLLDFRNVVHQHVLNATLQGHRR
jgi:hypothetical protein